jgi:hypothetical protein
MFRSFFVSEKVSGLEDARYKVRNDLSLWRPFYEDPEDGMIPCKKYGNNFCIRKVGGQEDDRC